MGFNMKGDFDEWLKEQAKCSNCETYYGHSRCGSLRSDELKAAMSEASGVPVQSFTVDPNESACWCPLWNPEDDWRSRMRRSWDIQMEEQSSAHRQRAAVSRIKSYELGA